MWNSSIMILINKHLDQLKSFSTVKYMAPQNISVSWLTNSLVLRWPAPEEHPALAEVRILPNGGPTESSETVSCLTFLSVDLLFEHFMWQSQ